MRFEYLCLLIISAILISGCIAGADNVCSEGKCFSVEVADTPGERETGLMNRDYMEPGTGMLFIFESEGRQNFWMKNTLIPLDMIWIDKGHRIVHIESNVPPCESDPCPVYGTTHDALYVLELNAGEAEAAGLKLNSVFEMRLS